MEDDVGSLSLPFALEQISLSRPSIRTVGMLSLYTISTWIHRISFIFIQFILEVFVVFQAFGRLIPKH